MTRETQHSTPFDETRNATRCERSLHLRDDVRGCRVQTRSISGQLAFAGEDARQALHRMEEALNLAVSVCHRELDEFLAGLEA